MANRGRPNQHAHASYGADTVANLNFKYSFTTAPAHSLKSYPSIPKSHPSFVSLFSNKDDYKEFLTHLKRLYAYSNYSSQSFVSHFIKESLFYFREKLPRKFSKQVIPLQMSFYILAGLLANANAIKKDIKEDYTLGSLIYEILCKFDLPEEVLKEAITQLNLSFYEDVNNYFMATLNSPEYKKFYDNLSSSLDPTLTQIALENILTKDLPRGETIKFPSYTTNFENYSYSLLFLYYLYNLSKDSSNLPAPLKRRLVGYANMMLSNNLIAVYSMAKRYEKAQSILSSKPTLNDKVLSYYILNYELLYDDTSYNEFYNNIFYSDINDLDHRFILPIYEYYIKKKTPLSKIPRFLLYLLLSSSYLLKRYTVISNPDNNTYILTKTTYGRNSYKQPYKKLPDDYIPALLDGIDPSKSFLYNYLKLQYNMHSLLSSPIHVNQQDEMEKNLKKFESAKSIDTQIAYSNYKDNKDLFTLYIDYLMSFVYPTKKQKHLYNQVIYMIKNLQKYKHINNINTRRAYILKYILYNPNTT